MSIPWARKETFYLKDPQQTKPDSHRTVRKDQYEQYHEAQSINSGLLQVYLEVDQFYKSIPVEFKLNQRDSEKDTKRDENEGEFYEMHVKSICVFYQPPNGENSLGIWSEEGCEVVNELSNPSQTFCRCSHTTMFAINSLVNENKMDAFVPSEYRIISYIGSNVALVINIVNFMFQLNVDRVMTNEQNKVHYLLVQTVIFFQLVYLVGVERKDVPILCKLTAFILQNCMLMAFCWNFCVGLYLLNRVKKFIVGKVLLRFMIFNVISWGYPAVISVLFYLLFEDRYGKGTGCYIAMGNFWPVFYAPRVPIFIGNISCLVTVVLKLRKLKNMKKCLRKQIMYTVKGELVVIPTIQMTFLFCAQGMQSRELIFQIGNGLTLVVLSVVLLFYTTLLNPEFWEARAKIRQRDSQIKKFNTISKLERKIEQKMEMLRNRNLLKKYKTQENESEIPRTEAKSGGKTVAETSLAETALNGSNSLAEVSLAETALAENELQIEGQNENSERIESGKPTIARVQRAEKDLAESDGNSSDDSETVSVILDSILLSPSPRSD